MKWGNEVLKMKIGPGHDRGAVSPQTLKNIRRVNKVKKMTEKVAGGILSGVLKITGYFGTSVANSRLGKKFFKFLPGEMALATLDGFGKVCDAFEVSGRNVMTTSSTVTTDIVTYKYGEETAKATNEGLNAAGHAVGAAWTVFKIRTAVNPRSMIAPSVLGKMMLCFCWTFTRVLIALHICLVGPYCIRVGKATDLTYRESVACFIAYVSKSSKIVVEKLTVPVTTA
ncbi:senescence/dehydration-associated protein At4g35985, chloroplastic-like [Bidens hawaiensis]|uniref:senescence/dehydration-associated protein At4g35985, chloroplastic-like n=1 Tax=Bidens hawaiensis TaxID=980011 RepID=UPI004049D32A